MIFTILFIGFLPLLCTSQGFSEGTKCGEILTEPIGSISYKEFIPLAPNERCTWIIRVPNATNYNVTLAMAGNVFVPKFMGFNMDRGSDDWTLTAGETVEISNMTLLIVTLYSNSSINRGNGFQVFYESDNPDNGQVSPNSENVFVNTDLGNIRHPAKPTDVNLRDLSVFMFSPINNVYNENRTIEVTYSRIGLLDPDCGANELQMYYLDAESYSMWAKKGRICGDITNIKLQSKDTILVVFFNDNDYWQRPGFELTYVNKLIE